ncbi:MAG: redoxin domain-containing protein [Planctomycetes bacterium]|nr:redoxin domain-containing protein [Planctomycetota bacterium]
MFASLGHAVLAAVLAACCPAPLAEPQEVVSTRATFGEPIAACDFFDVRFTRQTLSDFGPCHAFVLCFTRVDCPLAPRQLPWLEQLAREFAPLGAQFVGVDVGGDDTVVDAAALALDHGTTFPFVLDHDLATARACGATRAGEVVVLDGQQRLRYRGRIDRRHRVGGEQGEPGRADLRLAIEAVLAGRTPDVAETPAEGCLISPAPIPSTGITWSEHIAPLLARHCVECHHAGGDAPFALQEAASAAAHAAMIAEVVAIGRMPPWDAARAHGRFTNQRGLIAGERRLLMDWARTGAAIGAPDARALPAPAGAAVRAANGGWRIGPPDLVLTTPTEMQVPATGILPYQYAILPHVFVEETWVEAVEIRAENPRVMHHCNLAHVRLGEAYRTEHFITGQVPGGDPLELEPGVAVRLPAGSLLALQIHYVTAGKEERDRIAVALRFPRTPVQKELHHFEIADQHFAIPPGAPAHAVAASATFPVDAVGIGMFVHMHLRGRDMRFEAITADLSSRETLLLVPTYDFDWQQSYRWIPGEQRFAAGTRVECLAHFDNSRFNPWNPDPTATVRFGQQTAQEMMYGFLFWTAVDEKLNLAVDRATGRARR